MDTTGQATTFSATRKQARVRGVDTGTAQTPAASPASRFLAWDLLLLSTCLVSLVASGCSDKEDQLIPVAKIPPSITSTAQTTAVVGTLYTYTIVAKGLPAPTISVTGLPAWLTFSGTAISGTPSVDDVGKTGTITVIASNGLTPGAAQHFAITVTDTPSAPVITSTPITTATVGTLYTYTITADGTPTPTITASSLPGWLNLASDTLSGTPGASDLGTTGTITITAANGVNPNATETFQITVNGIAPTITSTAPTSAAVDNAYSYTITADGVPTPVIDVSGAPSWLTLSGNVLSGTPGAGDVGTTGIITVTASNGVNPDATQAFTITVKVTVMFITHIERNSIDLIRPYLDESKFYVCKWNYIFPDFPIWGDYFVYNTSDPAVNVKLGEFEAEGFSNILYVDLTESHISISDNWSDSVIESADWWSLMTLDPSKSWYQYLKAGMLDLTVRFPTIGGFAIDRLDRCRNNQEEVWAAQLLDEVSQESLIPVKYVMNSLQPWMTDLASRAAFLGSDGINSDEPFLSQAIADYGNLASYAELGDFYINPYMGLPEAELLVAFNKILAKHGFIFIDDYYWDILIPELFP